MSSAESQARRFDVRRILDSLAARLIAGYIAIFFALILVFIALAASVFHEELNWIDDQTLENRFQTVREVMADPEDRAFWLEYQVNEGSEGPRRTFIRIIADTGAVVHEAKGMNAHLPLERIPHIPFANSRGVTDLQGLQKADFRVLVRHAPWPEQGGVRNYVVQIAVERTLDEIAFDRYARIAIFVGAALFFVGGAATLVLSRRVLEPLRRMGKDIEQVNHLSLQGRVGLDGLTAELRELAKRFNQLLDRLEKASEGVQQYADDVAHELRTPLNKIGLAADVALQHQRTDQEYRAFLEYIAEDSKALNLMVERMLFLARATHHQEALTLGVFDVMEELNRISEYFEGRASEREMTISVEATPCQVEGDRILLQRALSNLVGNALAHGRPGDRVVLSAARVGDWAHIRVSDTGPGIAPEHLALVFNRFYRADKTRPSQGGRLGLGLPITKSIVELHKGEIEIRARDGGGLVCDIRLPARQLPAHLEKVQ